MTFIATGRVKCNFIQVFSKFSITLLFLGLFSHFAMAGKKIPDWAINPEPDNQQYIFGVGQGSDDTNAKLAALESIAGKLLTKIESSLEVDTRSADDQYSENVKSNVRSQVAKTNLTGYEVLEVKKVKKKEYWAKIRISREKLYDANWSEFNDALASLEATFSHDSKNSVLTLRQESESIEEIFTRARNKLVISKSVNASVDYGKYSQILTDYEQDYKAKLATLVIYLKASDDLIPLAENIAGLFAVENISATVNQPTIATPTISLMGSYSEEVMLNQKAAIANLAIEVSDEFGRTVLTKKHNLRGASNLSYDKARVAAVNRYIRDIDIDGVLEYFGLVSEEY